MKPPAHYASSPDPNAPESPPWLQTAVAQRDHPEVSAASAATFSLAIRFANGEMGGKSFVTCRKPGRPLGDDPEEEIQWAKRYKAVHEEFCAAVAEFRAAPDAALKVGAGYALQQLLARLRHETGREPTLAEVQRALLAATDEPPALVAVDDPQAQKLNGPWVAKVLATLRHWAARLSHLFSPQPWCGEDWNRTWANTIALYELERLIVNAGFQGEGLICWDAVINALLQSVGPPTKHNGACLPTDKVSKLEVQLQLHQWLAKVLVPGLFLIPFSRAQNLCSVRFQVYRLGNRDKTEVFQSDGLRVGHLYLAVFSQRMSQSTSATAIHHHSPPMKIAPPPSPPLKPPDELPGELHGTLLPGDWSAALFGITQEKALRAHHAHPAGHRVRLLDAVQPHQPRLKTRRATPVLDKVFPPLRALPADMICWQLPSDPSSPGLGSMWLSPCTLNPPNPPQYTDCFVLVQHQARWYVVRPELVQDGDGEAAELAERVELLPYAPLHAALQEVGGWSVLAQAMPKANWVAHFRGSGLLLVAVVSLSEIAAMGD